jgi:hypothetical protein
MITVKSRIAITLVLLSTLSVLNGCTTTQDDSRSPPCTTPEKYPGIQCFNEPHDAPAGMAKVYIFRPDTRSYYTSDKPVVIIDNNIEITLARSSYAPVNMALGRHHFKLAPGDRDSKIWNLEGDFDVQAAGRYYLAIWDPESSSRPSFFAGISTGFATSAFISGLTLLFPISGDGAHPKYELVKEEDALPSIRDCELSVPVNLNPGNSPHPKQ